MGSQYDGRTDTICGDRYIRKHIGYDDYLKEYARERRISEEDLFTVLTEIQEKAKDYQMPGMARLY